MLVEMMTAIARKDYEQRRERQAQVIEKDKAAGKYQGRPVDEDLHKRVTTAPRRPGHSRYSSARYLPDDNGPTDQGFGQDRSGE